MDANGSHVSRAEMREALEPIRDDIREIKNDLKPVLLAMAAETGGKAASKDKSARRLAWAAVTAAVCGDVATVIWLTH